MKLVRQLGVVLLLVSYLTPAMACTIADVPMSAAERACCRDMQNQCEQMGMPASHGCCQKAGPGRHDSALDTKAAPLHTIEIAPVWLTASDLLNPASTVGRSAEGPDHSPPTSPPSAFSILRI